jgi:YVTN family beta-propeller protein
MNRISSLAKRHRLIALVGFPIVVVGLIAATVLANATMHSGPEPRVVQDTGQRPSPDTSHLLPVAWQHPQPGWLYVLDPNGLDLESQILLVDPRAGKVMGVLRTGNDPAMALSPDGTQLYVASRRDGSDSLSIVDTATGQVIRKTVISDRWGDTVLPISPTMTVSADGSHLYVHTLRSDATGNEAEEVVTLDTASGGRGQSMPLSGCHYGLLLPAPAGEPRALCQETHDIRSIGQASASAAPGALPVITDDRRDAHGNPLHLGAWVAAAIGPDGTPYSVTANGRLSVVASGGHAASRTVDLGIPKDRSVLPGLPVVSPDGSTIFIPLQTLANRSQHRGDEVLVVDTTQLKTLRTIQLSRPFWSLAMSLDGKQLYAIQPETRSLTVVETSTGRESAVVTGVGASPALSLVAP